MKRLFTILIETSVGLFLGITVIVATVVLLPVIVIGIPFTLFNNWMSERELRKFLNLLGDKNFFCYNNRADTRDFLENELIPKLDKDIEFIYLDGRKPKSKYIQDHISLALYKLKNYSGFPHLLKIRDGVMVDKSINNEVFDTMTQNKPLDKLLSEINIFFGL
jgi:hypothetical protein